MQKVKLTRAQAERTAARWPEFAEALAAIDGDPVWIELSSIRRHVDEPGWAVPGKVTAGPGTELRRIFKEVGFVETPGCLCVARSSEMDRRGVQWCKDNIDLIVDWLREEAFRMAIPFFAPPVKRMVKKAIAAADAKT